MIVSNFAPLLRTYRLKAMISQSKLAVRAGYNHSFVSRMEAGERLPSLETVERLATALKLNKAEQEQLLISAGFLPTSNAAFFAVPELYELNQLYQIAPPSVQADLRGFLHVAISHAGGRDSGD